MTADYLRTHKTGEPLSDHTSTPVPGTLPEHGFSRTSETLHRPSSAPRSGIVNRVREQATAKLSSQKDRASDGLVSVVSAARESTQHLRDQKHDTVARYVEQAADQIERVSHRLKEKNINELVDDAQRLARQQPGLFIGGAFALGLLGARFLKSSSRDSQQEGHKYEPQDLTGSFGSTSSSLRPATSARLSDEAARQRERF